jgi:hypothetical protein
MNDAQVTPCLPNALSSHTAQHLTEDYEIMCQASAGSCKMIEDAALRRSHKHGDETELRQRVRVMAIKLNNG